MSTEERDNFSAALNRMEGDAWLGSPVQLVVVVLVATGAKNSTAKRGSVVLLLKLLCSERCSYLAWLGHAKFFNANDNIENSLAFFNG